MTDSFQWERCASDGGSSCSDIPAATGSSYALTADDVGHIIRVRGSRDGVLVGESGPVGPVTSAPVPGSVAAPIAPASYTVPAGATRVTTAAQLAAALAATSAADIVVADGTYDQSSPFQSRAAHRVYAENLGGATLTAGITVQSGGTLRGLKFNTSATAKMAGNACVRRDFETPATLSVLDCWFEGNWATAYGIIDYTPHQASYQRLVFAHFTDVALRASDNKAVAYGAATHKIQVISDIDVDGVSRATPGASNGTAEAGLFIGHPVLSGVARVKCRNVSWSGVEPVNNAWDTVYRDLDIDMSGPHISAGVGVYCEHFSRHLTFQASLIKGKIGLNGEWDDDSPGNAAMHNCTIDGVTFDGAGFAHSAGVNLDQGSDSTTVTGCTFTGHTFAAIAAYRNVGSNSFDVGNSYSLGAGGVEFTTAHI